MAVLMMVLAATQITLTSLPISGYLPNYHRIFKIKSIMEMEVCREKTILNYQWVKFLKWKNPSMMNIADGLRYFLVQQTKAEIRPQVGTIKASRICMLTKAVISIIQIQLLTKGISQELVHPKISIWQRKKRKIYFFTHRERVEQHSIVQRMNLLS
jgi:hypothetical protein